MKGNIIGAVALLMVMLNLIQPARSVDCFGWSWTKRSSYMEMLPQLLYYDKVDWINLDPGRTCTFKTTEAVFVQLLHKNLTATYQVYKENSNL